ncbi:MAG: translocation protein TolB [Thermoflexibacter sp.]|jgi:Tol biopolymer transport system component|nr:translocation protein TolB [Thermoflexibacter sp.]
MIKRILFFTTTLIFFSQLAFGQFTQFTFGKNRVQYKDFEWQYISSTNFEVFFYKDGEKTARLTAQFAEDDFLKITDFVGFAPYSKIKIFVYNSTTDLLQSNIGINRQNFTYGGQTNFTKSQIEIAFTGTKTNYKDELRRTIAEMLIYEMMYGGNLKDMLQSSYLLSLPEWFISGAAEYIGKGWNVALDNYMQDALLNRKMKRLENLEGEEAKIVGQSIWNYIVEKYGKPNIANILNLTRIVRNEESSIQNTLGVSFPRFLTQWKNFYYEQGKTILESHKQPDKSSLLKINDKNYVYNKIIFSPDGNLLAFSENEKGRYKIKIRDFSTNKEFILEKGGYQIISQRIDYDIPVFAWKDNNTLVVVDEQEGKETNLLFFNIKTKKAIPVYFNYFTHIEDMDISDDGEMLVISASKDGQSDIYTYLIENKKLTNITNDIFDDLNPAFLKKSRAVVFSSNRINDTISNTKYKLNILSDRFNIFIYNPQNAKILKRVSNTLSNDIKPIAINDKTILFSSDQRGIYHLYRYDIKDEVSSQITNFSQSVQSYDYKGNRLAVNLLNGGIQNIYLIDGFDISVSTFTNKTMRQQLLDVRRLNAMKNKTNQNKTSIDDKDDEEEEDTNTKKDNTKLDSAKKNTTINTDDYQFDTFNKQPKKKKLLKNYRPSVTEEESKDLESIKIDGAFSYESKFGVDNTIFAIVIDPLRGPGFVLQGSMTDVLENHKFNAGIFALTSLRSGNYFVEYEYLKKRFDYRLRYDRQSLSFTPSYFTQRYLLNKVQASASYPLNITTRFTGGAFIANTGFSVTSDQIPSVLRVPDKSVNYAGFNLEFVYDNSTTKGLNVMDGARLQVRYENFFGLSERGRSFGNLSLDGRLYRQLGKAFIFAARAAYGQFSGSSPKTYRLGGMNNWLFSQAEPVTPTNPLYVDPNEPSKDLSNLLFTQYIGSMRGFNWNKLSGNNYVLFNAELRMPFLKYFYKSSMTSNFLRNLQFVAFTDVGAAWTGISPFNRENALNTTIIESTPFFAKVSNFKNPFLVGYGLGVRTLLLGYYAKFDVGWGFEDKTIVPPTFYFTLGYDF